MGNATISQLDEQRYDGCEQFALDSVAAAIRTQALLRLSPDANHSATASHPLSVVLQH